MARNHGEYKDITFDKYSRRKAGRKSWEGLPTDIDGLPIVWSPITSPSQVEEKAVVPLVPFEGKTTIRQIDIKPMSQDDLELALPFDPVEKLGQNFLVDPEIIRLFWQATVPGANVVEIGVGPANLTPGIAESANQVTGLEIFPDFASIQQSNLADYSNVEIVFGDALRFDFVSWVRNSDPDIPLQIMGNIPFHISEGLLIRCAQIGRRLESIVLIVGQNLQEIIDVSQKPYHERYSKLAFVASIFETVSSVDIPNDCFWPAPPVNGGLVTLVPREFDPNGNDMALKIRREIITNPELAVGKIIKGLSRQTSSKQLDGKGQNRYDRRRTKDGLKQFVGRRVDSLMDDTDQIDTQGRRANNLLSRINLPEDLLNTPFNRLDNGQIKMLAQALADL